jgi:hypothetical protein
MATQKRKSTVHCRSDQHTNDTVCGTRSKRGNLKYSQSFMSLGKDVTCKKCKKVWHK